MPSFMDFYRQDIDTVLMDKEEKAVDLEINGKMLTVIKDDDKLAEMKNKAQYADAIYRAELLLFIRAADLEYIPAPESSMTVGEQTYQVADVSGDLLLQIILEAVQ